MRGKKARQLRVDRTAERRAARRRQRQQTLFTVVVIAIIVGIGGVLVALSLDETPADLADDATESPTDPASEGPDERAVACGADAPANAGADKPTFDEPEQVLEEGVDYRAVIVTSCGRIPVDLDEERAPETVNSFVFLAQQGFFDGLEIFRNATSIGALQTGAGTNEATWDIGYQLKDELQAAEDDGYPPGTLAMANSGPDTAGSQFFFVYNTKFQLDPTYAVFGRTNPAGLKVLRQIGHIPVVSPDGSDPEGAEKPSQITYIEKVRVTTEQG